MATNTSGTQDVMLKVQLSVISLIVIFPVCVYILYLGFRQWKSKRNDSFWFINYSDFFMYNLAILELVGCVGFLGTLCVIFYDYDKSYFFQRLSSFAWYGEMVFPVFTVIEHYVGVVHPMTYLSLKKGRGRLIRNISTGLVWVETLVLFPVIVRTGFELGFFIGDTCQTVLYLGTIFYCSVAVLKVLTLPKPGGAVHGKWKIEKSKQHAFLVIELILVMLMLKFFSNVIINIFVGILKIEVSQYYWYFISFWINIVTTRLLPLLYLQRAGKLQQCGRRFGIGR